MTQSTIEWATQINDWKSEFNFRLMPPASDQDVDQIEVDLGPLPGDILNLYRVSNGIFSDWFVVLPIEDSRDVKRTWDGVRRANTASKTHALGGDTELLKRFFVFARIGAGDFAVIDRQTGHIWYEEKGELIESSLNLVGFIRTCLLEVRDLL